jgi:hemerythrin
MYEMKPEFLTGITFIDEEHSKLFEIANNAYELLKDQFIIDKYDYIMNVINDLKEYTIYHFKHEEEYMGSIGYKKLLSHKVTHADFIDKLNSFDSSSIDENLKESLLQLLDIINTWLIEHILENDTLIGK